MNHLNLSDIDLNYNYILNYSNNTEIISIQEPGCTITVNISNIINYSLIESLIFIYPGTLIY